MTACFPRSLGLIQMTDQEYQNLAQLIHSRCGITIDMARKQMITTRLLKRLRHLGLTSFAEYHHYVRTPEGADIELPMMIDAVTTHTTEFFREAWHYEVLTKTVLPDLLNRHRFRATKQLMVWSAGCSTGEEPYSLGMTLADALQGSDGTFQMFATDISSRVLGVAQRAIYSEEQISAIPDAYQRAYLLRGKGDKYGQFRIVPELRQQMQFSRLNLMDPVYDLPKMDIICCRNVIIYFDNERKREIIRKLHASLHPRGYLFLGHSETLQGLSSEFRLIAPTVYQKTSSVTD